MDGHDHNNTHPSSHHQHEYSYNLFDQTTIEGPNESNQHVWDIVDSWFNDSPQIHHDDDHQHNVDSTFGGVSSHDDEHTHDNQVKGKEVVVGGGGVGIDGGDEGKRRSDHGIDNEGDTEEQYPEDDLRLRIMWPSAPVPGSCSSCQVLREIIHTKGTYSTKLEIHGEVGSISHAIYGSNDEIEIDDFQKRYMLDFSKQQLKDIKDYLKDYLEEHQENGYTFLQEPLSLFYEALCTGYEWLNFEGINSGAPFVGETSNPITKVQHRAKEQMMSELAIQRQRVKKMKLEDIAKYFDRRISDASEALRLCATVLKKKLRSYNISRWPYRKVQSLKRKILDLEAKHPIVRNRAVDAEIKKLEKKLADILSGKLKP